MEICNFSRFIEDIEIWFLRKCLLSSPPRFRQLLSKSLYSFGCYSNEKRKIAISAISLEIFEFCFYVNVC